VKPAVNPSVGEITTNIIIAKIPLTTRLPVIISPTIVREKPIITPAIAKSLMELCINIARRVNRSAIHSAPENPASITPLTISGGGQITPEIPYEAIDAPTIQPIRVLLAEIGKPLAVSSPRIKIPQSSAIMITTGVMAYGWIIPVPMVFAIAVVRRKGPAILHNAASNRAYSGFNALVATIVAIEFPAPFKPLTKLKASASITPKHRITSISTVACYNLA